MSMLICCEVRRMPWRNFVRSTSEKKAIVWAERRGQGHLRPSKIEKIIENNFDSTVTV